MRTDWVRCLFGTRLSANLIHRTTSRKASSVETRPKRIRMNAAFGTQEEDLAVSRLLGPPGKYLGSNRAPAVRSIAAIRPRQVCRRGAQMKIVSIIADPRIVDRIPRHRQSERCKAQDPLEPRPPPWPDASSVP
jgi:hypothetical protein